jgi:hypothetical protein
MHKRFYKLLLLLAVFIAALFFMSSHIKEEEITLENTVEMTEASFPLLYLKGSMATAAILPPVT